MKRSDIILKIANELVGPHFPEDVMKQADHILTKLESFGMLPPHHDATDYFWEPEDDDYYNKRSGAV